MLIILAELVNNTLNSHILILYIYYSWLDCQKIRYCLFRVLSDTFKVE